MTFDDLLWTVLGFIIGLPAFTLVRFFIMGG
jgi:hypothetical protein